MSGRRLAIAAAIPLSEAEFQRQVTELAELLGWQWVHFRPARTARGWRTPVEGPLGAGWPDLVLVRGRDRRLLFAELKRDGVKPNPSQTTVLGILESLQTSRSADRTYVQVFCWRPADFDLIAEVLR